MTEINYGYPPGTQIIHATLLGSPPPQSPKWFDLRRGGITATDLPQILGLSKFGNARTVWHTKRGELPDDYEESEEAKWGRILEGPIADEWARMNDVTVSPIGVLAHLHEPWMRASCDRVINGRNAALEVKTRSAYVAGRWRDEVPDDVLAQVAWQRMVGDFDYVEVACLLGGQHLTTYRYEKDQALEDYLWTQARELWDRVRSGEPPVVDMDGVLLRLLEQLYPDRSGVKTIPQEEAVGLVLNYSSAAALATLADNAKEAARAAILSVMEGAEVLEVDGGMQPLFTYRAQERQSISLKELEDHDVELFEQVLAGGHINTTISRVLRTGKGAKNVET
jgi:putative phage-type endonuclease